MEDRRDGAQPSRTTTKVSSERKHLNRKSLKACVYISGTDTERVIRGGDLKPPIAPIEARHKRSTPLSRCSRAVVNRDI